MNAATQSTNGAGKTEALPPVTAVREIEVASIDESPTQPRKTFLHVEELAKDVKEHGLLQPILVRPKNGKALSGAKARFEVVFGARRFRATKLAGLKTIAATVRELDDAKALELQIVENNQREDVHPLEEADGYLTLHEKHGYSVDEIAAKVGKSTATVYARLKYATLIPEARNAFLDDKLSAATALLVARIPHPDLQKKALAEVTKKGWQGELPSVREATRIVRDKFMLRLADAPFDRADLTLVAAAGGCAACPKRTGNQKELFADLESKDDLCTDPKCFGQKRDADAARRLEAAKAAGKEVMPDKEAKKIFYDGGAVKHDSGFVDLDAKDHDWQSGKATTKRQQLGKSEVDIVLARDPDGTVHELVKAKDFAKATKRPEPKPTKADLKREQERQADDRRRERDEAKHFAEVSALVTAAERRKPNDALWRALARVLGEEYFYKLKSIVQRRGLLEKGAELSPQSELTFVKKLSGAQARGLVVELLIESTTSGLEEVRGLFGKSSKRSAKLAPKAKSKTKAKPKG